MIEIKKCSKCKELLDANNFKMYNYNGVLRYKSLCIQCRKKTSWDEWVKIKNDPKKKARKRELVNARRQTIEFKLKNNEAQRQKRKDDKDNLKDPYIKTLLTDKGFRPHQITPELISAQRTLITIKIKLKDVNSKQTNRSK
jgi:hypothetical protein